ncbi:putative membrane protein [Raineyella antarctica]|uniref:Putative membrane protein n=1 Tax=Raineyella antarctica TaxID=1577474 RepID=A0A1G6HJY8_9ACTN|nr:hypothetical protein [Raineyella antarctica]SDB94647.1 putative membrane protein [Raineyella antarctica]
MMGYGGWGGMGWGAMIGMVLVWIVLIALIAWAVTRLLPARRVEGGSPQPPQETPEEILDRRFARGEIDLETYQAQRAALASARKERR